MVYVLGVHNNEKTCGNRVRNIYSNISQWWWFFSIFTRKSVTSLSDHWKLDLITTTTIHKSRWYLPDSRYEVATTSWSTVNNKGRKKHLHFSYQPDESLTFAFKMTHSSMLSLSVVRKVMLVLCRKVMVLHLDVCHAVYILRIRF